MENKRTTYSFDESELKLLKFICVMPACEERTAKINEVMLQDNWTVKSTIAFIESIVDLAVTVIENNREMVELIGITEMGMHPHDVGKINLPDLMGALAGYSLVLNIDQENLCHGCAYRKGSVANTCLPTTYDAHMCIENDETFFCHENIKDGDTPTRKCRGHLKNKKQGNGAYL